MRRLKQWRRWVSVALVPFVIYGLEWLQGDDVSLVALTITWPLISFVFFLLPDEFYGYE